MYRKTHTWEALKIKMKEIVLEITRSDLQYIAKYTVTMKHAWML
jgi:hypothetical protein